MKLRTGLFLLGLALSLSAQPGARYLIIAHDNFYDAIQPLAEWKLQKGISDTVVRLSQIGSTANQIRAFIVNAWNTWNPRPEYLLLVGSGYYIPAFARGHGEDALYTDNPFADMTGDYRAELVYGRLPCKTARQCSVMVAKTLAYERTPYMADTLWFRRGTTIVADSGDSDGWLYWEDARFYAGLAGAAGYAGIDSLSSSHHDDQADVVQSINNGTSFVLYRGTAGANWWLPFMVNPVQTNNGTRLPIICSFTCQTEALNRYDSMVGETWLRVGTPQALKGAVAFLGNTHSASHVAPPRSAMTKSFFEGVFSESLMHLGRVALRGKDSIFARFHDSLEYFGFNLLGDPELCLWTSTPQPLQVSYDSVIPGPGVFPVAVHRAGTAVAGALVCVMDGSGVYEYGYTDSSGSVAFAVNPRQPGTLHVSVTAFNCIPHEGSARITGGAVAEPPDPKSETRDPKVLTVYPNPGSGRFGIRVSVTSRLAVYDAGGRLKAVLLPKGGEAVWDAGTLSSGVYLIRALDADGVKAERVVRFVRPR
jgi:gingipain R